MSARDALLAEIDRLPEQVVEETLHFVRFVVRQRQEADLSDVLRSREAEQEVLDIIDAS